jgi:hypothetical protein
MLMQSFPANRPLLLRELELFIQDADRRELGEIRSAVKARRRTAKRVRRGRPSVSENRAIIKRALRATWMRIIEHGTRARVSAELKLANNTQPGDGKYSTLRDLRDYMAIAIYRAIPPTYIRQSVGSRDIAPGALDSKTVQTLIWQKTGLPFKTHPKECKRIVEALWPRGWALEAMRFEREFNARQRKRHS